MARIQLYVFTLSRLTVNYPKTGVVSSLQPGVHGQNIRFRSLRSCLHDLRASSFPKSFLITTIVLDWLFGDCLLYLFIYLFIQFQFSMSRSIRIQKVSNIIVWSGVSSHQDKKRWCRTLDSKWSWNKQPEIYIIKLTVFWLLLLEMNTANQVLILGEADWTSRSANSLGKGMNLTFLSLVTGK